MDDFSEAAVQPHIQFGEGHHYRFWGGAMPANNNHRVFKVHPSEPASTVVVQEIGVRLYAEPVRRILDRGTRSHVGWLYRWNTGAEVPMWTHGVKSDVIYE